MNKRTIVASLNEIANELDSNGLFKEANEVTEIMVKISQYDKLGPNSAAGRAVGLGDSKKEPKHQKSDEPKISDSLPSLDIPMPYDKFLGTPSKPYKPDTKKPKTADGLDRWVNKAENIYKAWGQKGANPNSSALGMIVDIAVYMNKLKSNLPTSLHGQADTKIAKVQEMLRNIDDGAYNQALVSTVTPYSSMSGYPGKGADPFGTGPRIQGKQLDYQARQEAKSY
jgi:hypothetical protein